MSAMNINQSTTGTAETPAPFPEHLPPRTVNQSWAQRNHATIGNVLTLNWRSYSLRGLPDGKTRARRLAMWTIMILRLCIDGFALFLVAYSPIGVFIFFVIISVIELFLVAWALAIIGDAQGERRFCGMHIGRRGFDIFLYVVTFLTVAYAPAWITPWSVRGVWPYMFLWAVGGLLIMGMGCVASLRPVPAKQLYPQENRPV